MTNEIRLNVPGTVITCGESKLVGEVKKIDAPWIHFKPNGVEDRHFFLISDWTFTYPAPKLPTEIGTVIESGGVRFMRRGREATWQWSSDEGLMPHRGHGHNDSEVLTHIEKHGGFTVLLTGTPTGGKE